MVCLDANVMLEVILCRQNHIRAIEAISRIKSRPYISMLSVHLVVYFSRVAHLPFSVIHDSLTKVDILDLNTEDYEWAKINMRDDDFEDALQIAVAIRSGCEMLLTLDKKLHDTYKSLPQLKIQLVK
ncbi:MAG: PINc protein [Patescibacteria group bacterium]|jgi:predicted nucleic acid-binding protein|nr:PINc protein [Patescibacteria group bacterium]